MSLVVPLLGRYCSAGSDKHAGHVRRGRRHTFLMICIFCWIVPIYDAVTKQGCCPYHSYPVDGSPGAVSNSPAKIPQPTAIAMDGLPYARAIRRNQIICHLPRWGRTVASPVVIAVPRIPMRTLADRRVRILLWVSRPSTASRIPIYRGRSAYPCWSFWHKTFDSQAPRLADHLLSINRSGPLRPLSVRTQGLLGHGTHQPHRF